MCDILTIYIYIIYYVNVWAAHAQFTARWWWPWNVAALFKAPVLRLEEWWIGARHTFLYVLICSHYMPAHVEMLLSCRLHCRCHVHDFALQDVRKLQLGIIVLPVSQCDLGSWAPGPPVVLPRTPDKPSEERTWSVGDWIEVSNTQLISASSKSNFTELLSCSICRGST